MKLGTLWSDRWTGGSVELVPQGSPTLLDLAEEGSPVVLLAEINIGSAGNILFSSEGWPAMLGSTVWGGGSEAGTSDTVQDTLLFSDLGWVGAPDDSVIPNQLYDARILGTGSIGRSFALRPWQSPATVATLGTIDLANADGYFDSLIQTPAEGREVVVRMAKAKRSNREWTDYADFITLFRAIAGRWLVRQDAASLEMSSFARTLEEPANNTVYGGGGGADGLAELDGLPKPLCYGRVFNISPPLIDSQYLVYQIHDGSVEAVDAVRDRGAALSFVSDHTTYSALTGASLTTGQYATSLSLGLIRIGSRASGLLTVDARGDNGDGYIDTPSAILDRYLCVRKGFSECGPGQFDLLPAVTAGFFTALEPITALAVLEQMVTGCGGALAEDNSARLRAYKLLDQSELGVDWIIREADILEYSPLRSPTPVRRVEVRYRRNYSPQPTDIAGSVSAANKEVYERDWRLATALSSADNLNAAARSEIILDTPIYAESAAQALADRLAKLHGKERRLFTIAVNTSGMAISLGAGVEVTHPRIGANVKFQVVGSALDIEAGIVTLTLWG